MAFGRFFFFFGGFATKLKFRTNFFFGGVFLKSTINKAIFLGMDFLRIGFFFNQVARLLRVVFFFWGGVDVTTSDLPLQPTSWYVFFFFFKLFLLVPLKKNQPSRKTYPVFFVFHVGSCSRKCLSKNVPW